MTVGGIAGIFNLNSELHLDSDILSDILKKMSYAIRHRGPDDESHYTDECVGLVYDRLAGNSILSEEPITWNEDSSICVIRDGRVFNYSELKDFLEKMGGALKTSSGINEIIICLYEQLGDNCFLKLDGMFAIVIYDKKKKRVFLARDRVGVKPLYYAIVNNKMIFASEIKAILQVKEVERKVNAEALYDYLLIDGTIGNKTFFKGIKKLLPGHYILAENGKVRVQQYWDININRRRAPEHYYIGLFEKLFSKSIFQRINGENEVACCLSGGIDSSLVASFLTNALPSKSVNTVTIGYRELTTYDSKHDERPYAKAVANHLGTRHLECVATLEDYISSLAIINWHLDQPSCAAFPLYFAFQVIGKHTKTLLTGDGGDELFGGYQDHIRARVSSILECYFSREKKRARLNDSEKKLSVSLRQVITWIWRENKAVVARTLFEFTVHMLPQKIRRGVLTAVYERYYKVKKLFSDALLTEIDNYSPRGLIDQHLQAVKGSYLNKIFYYNFKFFLPSFFDVAERVSMAFSLENRMPFLSNEIINFSASLPEHFLVKDCSTSKYILRKALSLRLPLKQVTERKKHPFVSPLNKWYRSSAMNQLLLKILKDPKFEKRGYFKQKFVNKLLDEHLSARKDHSRFLIALLNFEIWCRIYIDPHSVDERTIRDLEELLIKYANE